MPEYISTTLNSGLALQLRPRTYEEWLAQEDARFSVLEEAKAQTEARNVSGAELTIQRAYVAMRTTRLNTCVEHFADLRATLTMADIADIEHRLDALEKPSITEKN